MNEETHLFVFYIQCNLSHQIQ